MWMVMCGYFVVLFGLKFEAESCTFKKFEKGDCGPGRCRMIRAARSSNSRSGAVLISQ